MPGGDIVSQPDERETAAGFSVQTLSYPDRYELPMLGGGKTNRLERAVALEVDLCNRIKRCKASDGYVHEVMVEGEWREHQKFYSFPELLASDVYGIVRRKDGEKSHEVEERD